MVNADRHDLPQAVLDFGITDIRPYGNHALIIAFSNGNQDDLVHIHQLSFHWQQQPLPHLLNVIPASNSITLVWQQPIDRDLIIQATEQAITEQLPAITPNHHEVPIRYHQAPDLHTACDALGVTLSQFQQLHSEAQYRADMLGFMPGFAYLSGLPSTLQLPRKDTPRTRVPPGSVAIAANYCAVYPLASPGGWHLIGHTDHPFIQWHDNPQCTIKPLDTLRFVPVT